ncbi:MAG: TIM barrel protein, partial [Candidatus Aenigmatarchaeota archaeon]
MKIFLGPAGIPTVAEDRTTEGGIKKVFELGLNAMEIEFVRNVYLDQKKAEEVGKFAKELGISLTVHAPYFINLLSDNKTTVEASKKRILESLDRAERMEAKAVVVHAAYYGNLPREEAFEKMVEITKEILEEARERGIKKTLLAYETMAKESQFAGLDELLELMKKV